MSTKRILTGTIAAVGVLSVTVLAAMQAAQPTGVIKSADAAMTAVSALTPHAESKTYQLDPVHSSIVFRITHLGVAPFYGRFNEMSGRLVWNREDPTNSSLQITVKAESVDTNNRNRDEHLRSPDFFTVREFSEITFRSKNFELKDSNTYTVTGDLTLHGVTKPVTATLNRTGAGTHPRSGRELVGFETTFTIKRSDFNMNWGIENGVLGDEVTLIVAIEAIAD